MKKVLHTEIGYLTKDTETGEIDFDTRHPITPYENQVLPELVDGFEWVLVKIEYSEAEVIR